MTARDEEMENIGIFGVDKGLEYYKDHFKDRVRRYTDQIKLFEQHEGGLEEFAKGSSFFFFLLFFPWFARVRLIGLSSEFV